MLGSFPLCPLCPLCVASAATHNCRRPKADVVALVERAGCTPATRRASRCKVSLPEGLHTQSNKPRDPLLIPTELTIDAPPE